jgi:branched-chain amino acid transport system permease protein
MTFSEFVQHVVNALTSGSIYAMYALGIALIFGIMQLINFAHGELVMVGAFGVYLARDTNVVVMILVAIATSTCFALAMERIAFRPLRGAHPATLLVTSFTVSFLLQSIARLVFGSLPRAADISPVVRENITIGGITIPKLSVITFVVTAVLLGTVGIFLRRTRFGVQMRASAEDFQMARLVGVAANRVIAAAFAISGLLAGVASVLLMSQTGQVHPTVGLTPVLFGLVATVIGGLGSLTGAVLAGLLLGGLSTTLQVALPDALRPYRDAFLFATVFVLFVARPQGLVVVRAFRQRV